jgi:hypothetical protein
VWKGAGLHELQARPRQASIVQQQLAVAAALSGAGDNDSGECCPFQPLYCSTLGGAKYSSL